MAILITDPLLEAELLAQRRASGGDRFDEVWEGVYMMAPLANNEHQGLAADLGAIAKLVVGWPWGAQVYVGVNVSDREQDWESNFRCPDVAVFLAGTQAQDCGTHWFGGPDFAAEILSPRDRSREKLAFYASVGVRELLLIDRDPWQLELYRLKGKKLRLVGTSEPKQASLLASKVLPLSLRLMAGQPRPLLEIAHHDGVQHWRN